MKNRQSLYKKDRLGIEIEDNYLYNKRKTAEASIIFVQKRENKSWNETQSISKNKWSFASMTDSCTKKKKQVLELKMLN